MRVDSVLEMPTGDQIGENRVPNLNYASDHFSLLADLRLIIWRKKKKLLKCFFLKTLKKRHFCLKNTAHPHHIPPLIKKHSG